MAQWQKAELISPEIVDTLETATDALQESVGLFSTVAGLLADVAGFVAEFQLDRVNGYFALIEAVITQIRDALNDFRNSGAYLLFTFPTSIEDTQGLNGFLQQLEQSFEDKADPNRPQFSENALYYAFIGLVGAPSPFLFFDQVQTLAKFVGNDLIGEGDLEERLLNQPHAILRNSVSNDLLNQPVSVKLELFPGPVDFPASGVLNFGSETIRYTSERYSKLTELDYPFLDTSSSTLENAIFRFPHFEGELITVRQASEEWSRSVKEYGITPDTKKRRQAADEVLSLSQCYTTNILLPRPSPVSFPTTIQRTRAARDEDGELILTEEDTASQQYTVAVGQPPNERLVVREDSEKVRTTPKLETTTVPGNLMGLLAETGNVDSEGGFGFEYSSQKVNLTNLPQVSVPSLKGYDSDGTQDEAKTFYAPPASGYCRIGNEIVFYQGLVGGGEVGYEEPFTEPTSMDALVTERHEVGEPVVFLKDKPNLPTSQFPDWSSFTLGGLPFVSEVFSGIESILNGILLAESSNSALARTIQTISRNLQDLQSRIDAVSDALDFIESIANLDLSFLTISGAQGKSEFFSEIRSAENAPDLPSNTFVAGFVALTATPGIDENGLKEMKRNIFDKPLDIPPKLREFVEDPEDAVFGGSAFDTLSKLLGG